MSRWGNGTIHDISSSGISFRTRRPLPVGGHVELIIDWPATHDDRYPITLHATGFVVRRSGNKIAVQIPSPRFVIQTEARLTAATCTSPWTRTGDSGYHTTVPRRPPARRLFGR